jgi:NADPH:quinone reductase-like Zn-dependent oxidoreductase
VGSLGDLLTSPWVSITGGRKIVGGTAAGRLEDLRYLADLAAAGEYRPVIDRRYPFEQIAEAHRYVDTGRKRGNVVVTLE